VNDETKNQTETSETGSVTPSQRFWRAVDNNRKWHITSHKSLETSKETLDTMVLGASRETGSGPGGRDRLEVKTETEYQYIEKIRTDTETNERVKTVFDVCVKIIDSINTKTPLNKIKLLKTIYDHNYDLAGYLFNRGEDTQLIRLTRETFERYEIEVEKLRQEQSKQIIKPGSAKAELQRAQNEDNKNEDKDVIYLINTDVIKTKAFKDAQAVAASEGLELVAFDSIGGDSLCNGFRYDGSKRIFINSLTYDRTNISGDKLLQIPTESELEQYVMPTFAHEYTHYFEEKSPGKYGELIELARSFTELNFERFTAENEKNISHYPANEKLSENIADFVATYLTRQDFWEYVAYKNKELCEVMQSTLKQFSERTQKYIETFVTNDQQRERVLAELRQLEEQILKLHEAAYTGKGKGTGARKRNKRVIANKDKHKNMCIFYP